MPWKCPHFIPFNWWFVHNTQLTHYTTHMHTHKQARVPFEINNPRPRPPKAREVFSCSNARNRCRIISGAMPMPVSLTSMQIPRCSGASCFDSCRVFDAGGSAVWDDVSMSPLCGVGAISTLEVRMVMVPWSRVNLIALRRRFSST